MNSAQRSSSGAVCPFLLRVRILRYSSKISGEAKTSNRFSAHNSKTRKGVPPQRIPDTTTFVSRTTLTPGLLNQRPDIPLLEACLACILPRRLRHPLEGRHV